MVQWPIPAGTEYPVDVMADPVLRAERNTGVFLNRELCMQKILNQIIRMGEKIYASIAIVLMMVLVIIITAGIIARYFFNSPFFWTEELATLLFIWIAFLAAAVAAARKKFIVVDYFIAKIPPSVQVIIGIVSDLLIMVFLGMVIVGAVLLLPQMHTRFSVALEFPRSLYFLPVLISSLLIFIVDLESLFQRLISLLSKKQTGGNFA